MIEMIGMTTLDLLLVSKEASSVKRQASGKESILPI